MTRPGYRLVDVANVNNGTWGVGETGRSGSRRSD